MSRTTLTLMALGLLATLPAAAAPLPPVDLRSAFPEDGGPADGWTFGWHGYARMSVPLHDGPLGDRPPYLIDDRYFESGFAYTRVNERSWAELALSAEKDDTRFVAGLFASEFSDWSQVKLEQQSGVATGFVEHTEHLGPLDINLRAGMFWERLGYLEPYDTYLFGRTHLGGARLHLRLLDRIYLQLGYGAHQKVANQGFSPMSWALLGAELPFPGGRVDASAFASKAWTEDGAYDFGPLKGAKSALRTLGGDLKVGLDAFGRLRFVITHVKADDVAFLGGTVELLHATGGQQLVANYFGGEGNGELLVMAWDLKWSPARSFAPHLLRGLDLRAFGMTIESISPQDLPDNPAENRQNRRYLKWGTELRWRPMALGLDRPWLSLRFDRVILDTDHESLAFRVVTPRLGFTPVEGVDLFASYSLYTYGDNLFAMPDVRQSVGEDTRPDERVFRVQATARW